MHDAMTATSGSAGEFCDWHHEPFHLHQGYAVFAETFHAFFVRP